MSRETSMGGGPRGFSPTLWTVVLRARGRYAELYGTWAEDAA